MRILHINTYDTQGGAARSAHRLHHGLLQLGHDSRMLVRHKVSAENQILAARLAQSEAVMQRANWIFNETVLENRTPISNTHFSLPAPSWDISDHPEVRTADVLNLHWVADFLSIPPLAALSRSGLPMVWTLHDQRPMTGGCHFTAGCDHFETHCGNCPQLRNWSDELPRSILSDSLDDWGETRPTIVCPSRWLADCARRSALFNNTRVEVIPYGLDTTVFCPQPPGPARKEFGLAPSAVVILFGADCVHEKRKGFHVLQAGLEAAMENPEFKNAIKSGEVVMASFGDRGNELPEFGLPVHNLGRVTSDAALARLYSAVDAVVLPSLEDNLPNVMLEAMCCGTPVLGHDVGGVGDVIEDGRNGLLAPADNPGAFAKAVCRLALDTPLRKGMATVCREEIPIRFDLKTQATRYETLYGELGSWIKRPKNGQEGVSCRQAAWGGRFSAIGQTVREKPIKRSRLRRLLDKFGRVTKT